MSDEALIFETLRQDALRHGMIELAIAYGWVVIRLNEERINSLQRDIIEGSGE